LLAPIALSAAKLPIFSYIKEKKVCPDTATPTINPRRIVVRNEVGMPVFLIYQSIVFQKKAFSV
jgi:hypothetical protein